jgi:hypothetical protein
MTTTITADTGAVSGTAGLKQSADSSGILALATGTGTTAVTIDASQNVGIGTSSPTLKLEVSNGTNTGYMHPGVGIGLSVGSKTNAPLTLDVNNTERARIDTSGNLLVGTSDAGTSTGAGLKLLTGTTAPAYATVLNTSAANNAYFLYNTNATNNGYRFYVGANGGINNYSANNVNISDERTKTNIENAGGYLAKICAIPVRTFKYKDQSDDLLNLGVIAQEVEAVAPELVDTSGFGETPEDGVPLKAIYQTDLQYALMKCIQEQQALITTLTERISALEAK